MKVILVEFLSDCTFTLIEAAVGPGWVAMSRGDKIVININ